MKNASPEDLKNTIRALLKRFPYDGLYFASMDHSPSEQLSGDDWHTTVLILSAGVQHADLAKQIAKRLHPKNPRITKWKNGTRNWRRHFLSTFFDELPKFPVYVFAVSARKQNIIDAAPHFVTELGLGKLYQSNQREKDRTSISVGPFSTNEGSPVTVELSENRAIGCLFVSHFVLRMHRAMHEAIITNKVASLVNWNFYGDKFPGNQENGMSLLFRILLTRANPYGRLLWGYFKESNAVETDLLADNVAGALNNAISRSRPPTLAAHDVNQINGLMYWEQWG